MAKRTCSVVLLLGAVLLPCTAPFSFAGDLEAVATYEAVGIYAPAPERPADCPVRYRKAGAAQWRAALDLWYDARSRECRGSVVNLDPGTRYEAEVLTAKGRSASVAFATRPDRVPVARVVAVPAGRRTFTIKQGGTAKGYVVYDGHGATLDAHGGEDFNVVVEASYVVVRGLTLKGAARDAIRIENHVTDVVIEDNDISGWGRKRDNGFGMDMDAAIRALCHSCPVVERITVQRNRIHDPRYSANSWSDGHPEGPQAIAFSSCGGQHVIRHNEIVGGEGKHYNDAIGGEENFSRAGFPNSDTDIYGNVIRDAWDDGIEAEGANRNVRIWGNSIDNTATGVGATPTTVGPLYIFRNVYNRSRFRGKVPPDEDERQPFVKAGSAPALGDGRRYVIHNTMLQSREPGSKLPLGAAAGLGGTGAAQPINNTWTRNNIFEPWKEGKGMWDVGRDNDFKGDVTRKQGVDAGVRVPNFNDGYEGKAPDAGAHEAGTPAMKFGIAASKGPAAAVSPAKAGAQGGP
jgi:hypothetical protein